MRIFHCTVVGGLQRQHIAETAEAAALEAVQDHCAETGIYAEEYRVDVVKQNNSGVSYMVTVDYEPRFTASEVEE